MRSAKGDSGFSSARRAAVVTKTLYRDDFQMTDSPRQTNR